MVTIKLIPQSEFARVVAAPIDRFARLELLAAMCRANTLAIVKQAGSGHLGSSFSALDLLVWLYYAEMNTVRLGANHPDRDIYFTSKGHDVPGLYSVLFALSIIPEERFVRLRRLNGMDGHPDIGVPGIEANTGSLGMGISKGRGMAWAKRRLGRAGRVIVMTGDGEFQEGQNFEALQAAAHQCVENLIVIMDHNKVQSDKQVRDILDLQNLNRKFQSFGWFVQRCDGHDFSAIERAFRVFDAIPSCPKILVADTIKGRGVSFMEHPVAIRDGDGIYAWHAGAPDDEAFRRGHNELIDTINGRLAALGLSPVQTYAMASQAPSKGDGCAQEGEDALGGSTPGTSPQRNVPAEHVAEAYGTALLDMAERHPELVVLDADLAADCQIRRFEKAYPDRFIENGIAEQDMVSMAGGLARQGLLPVVNSFASFLASRANEQIYNNSTEGSRILYVCHFAGLIPAGPGKSHQSLRDISLFAALSGCTVIQPCNAAEAKMALSYCIEQARGSCMLRLNIGPSPRRIELPEGYTFLLGHGVSLTAGNDAILFAYGPVMLHEALCAADILRGHGYLLSVVNMPWLNLVDVAWLSEIVRGAVPVFVLEDHAPAGGLGDRLLCTLAREQLLGDRTFRKLAVEGHPACGTPSEVLRHHGLDAVSIASRVADACQWPIPATAFEASGVPV